VTTVSNLLSISRGAVRSVLLRRTKKVNRAPRSTGVDRYSDPRFRPIPAHVANTRGDAHDDGAQTSDSADALNHRGCDRCRSGTTAPKRIAVVTPQWLVMLVWFS
jgi:hypothetical protein